MKLKISPSRLCGAVSAPPSKSYAHRMLICAALADGKSVIHGVTESEDMLATLDCIEALGAGYERDGDTITVWGAQGDVPPNAVFRCRESGSTLRFMIPPALTGARVRFTGTTRLLERGIGIYETLLGQKGIEIEKTEAGIELCGKLNSGEYTLRGDVSSQFISGLMFALPKLEGDSVINILPPVESRAYIDVTVAVLRKFGIEVTETEDARFFIKGGQKFVAHEDTVEGDWSNAAALFAFNSLGHDLEVGGLNHDSIQGDRVCVEYLKRLDEPNAVLDISNCPDLGPVLFATAAAKGHGARFTGTRRLRIKESDRAAVSAEELARFGACVTVGDNEVTVAPGKIHAPDGECSSHNDHRMVMALTLLMSMVCGTIDGAEAVRKSYPDFFDELKKLGLEVSNGA